MQTKLISALDLNSKSIYNNMNNIFKQYSQKGLIHN